MKRFCIVLFIVLIWLPAYAKHEFKEKEYQQIWCNNNGGIMEYKLDDNTRIDCLLPKMAVEFDFAFKWHECIGQALYYGKKTKRTPACVLILENENDIRFFYRLKYTVYEKQKIKDFKIFTVDKSIFN